MSRHSNAREQLAVLFLCAAVVPVQAAPAGKTNEAAISYITPTLDWNSKAPSDVLAERFLQEVVASDSLLFDRFSGPSSQLAWARRQNLVGYDVFEQVNSSGAKMFANLGLDSLRTAALEVLPFGRWQDYWQGRLANFITGTLGNPQEEHIDVTSVSYSAVRSSWERETEHAGIQWGFRPWRTSPYLYFLAHAGHMDGRPLITFEGRAGYTLFASTRIEARMSLQLPAGFRIAAGGALEPGKLGTRDTSSSHVGVTLERVMRSTSSLVPDSVFFLGVRSSVSGSSPNPRQENIILAGLSRPW